MARLNLLRSPGAVAQVLGYVVSKPLEIEDLKIFLARGWQPESPSQMLRRA